MNQKDPVDARELLAALVAVDTTNPGGDERAGVEVIARVFRDRGLPVEIDEYRPGNVNLTVRVHFGDGPIVLLNSHIDVVPTGGGWSSPPFEPRVVDGRMYGRGTADAKGSLAAMAAALTGLIDSPAGLSGTVVYTAVGDEEVGSTGARHLVTTLQADACIVGEPTDLRLFTAHKGSVRPVIEVRGIAAHAATPENGSNAIVGAAGVVTALGRLADELRTKSHPLVGAPTLTAVLISGGEAPNAVPEATRLTVDRRLIPGETGDEAVAQIDALLADWTAENPPFVARVISRAPSTGGPSETPVDDPFVLDAQRAMADVGEDPELGGLVVNCDMTTFRSAGIPTLVLGPGTLGVMHGKDEYVELAQVDRAVTAYTSILRRLLAAPPTPIARTNTHD
jgi:succinyl-diaminopimelate desuccinylase